MKVNDVLVINVEILLTVFLHHYNIIKNYLKLRFLLFYINSFTATVPELIHNIIV